MSFTPCPQKSIISFPLIRQFSLYPIESTRDSVHRPEWNSSRYSPEYSKHLSVAGERELGQAYQFSDHSDHYQMFQIWQLFQSRNGRMKFNGLLIEFTLYRLVANLNGHFE